MSTIQQIEGTNQIETICEKICEKKTYSAEMIDRNYPDIHGFIDSYLYKDIIDGMKPLLKKYISYNVDFDYPRNNYVVTAELKVVKGGIE